MCVTGSVGQMSHWTPRHGLSAPVTNRTREHEPTKNIGPNCSAWLASCLSETSRPNDGCSHRVSCRPLRYQRPLQLSSLLLPDLHPRPPHPEADSGHRARAPCTLHREGLIRDLIKMRIVCFLPHRINPHGFNLCPNILIYTGQHRKASAS